MTFASALRSILRQDPDIILIGEIRDLETAEIAISAALTGHFVLSTLHTNDAAGAISRLVNLGIPPFLVASAVIGSAAQRLIRTTCTKCRQTYQPGPDELNLLKLSGDENNDIQFYKGAGCDNCMKTGYSGRKAIYEILPVSADIRKLIVNSCSDDAIKELAITESMRTLQKSAIDEVLNGSTTFEELLRVVDMRA
jgi:type II secretory ATPase GspE/PulE/Tfp pilus assembly ATPase PilB-like protein